MRLMINLQEHRHAHAWRFFFGGALASASCFGTATIRRTKSVKRLKAPASEGSAFSVFSVFLFVDIGHVVAQVVG